MANKTYIEKNHLKAKIRYFIKTMDWGKEWNDCLETVLDMIDNEKEYAFQLVTKEEK